MTSLATLTHAIAAPFNANFYIVAATVIPVFFVAVVLQGGSYQAVIQAALTTVRKQRTRSSAARRALTVQAAGLLLSLAYAILVPGIVGEASALIALYQMRDSPGQHFAVLANTFLLSARQPGHR